MFCAPGSHVAPCPPPPLAAAAPLQNTAAAGPAPLQPQRSCGAHTSCPGGRAAADCRGGSWAGVSRRGASATSCLWRRSPCPSPPSASTSALAVRSLAAGPLSVLWLLMAEVLLLPRPSTRRLQHRLGARLPGVDSRWERVVQTDSGTVEHSIGHDTRVCRGPPAASDSFNGAGARTRAVAQPSCTRSHMVLSPGALA